MRLQLMRFYSPLKLRERMDALSLSAGDGYVTLSLAEGALRTDYVVSTDTWPERGPSETGMACMPSTGSNACPA